MDERYQEFATAEGMGADKADSIYKTLLESSAEGIIIVDRFGRIVLANVKALDLFGYTSLELLGSEAEILLPEPLREAHVRHRNEYITSPRNRPIGVGLELLALRKDGGEFPVEVSLSHAGAGDDLLVMATINDIAKRKELERDRAQLMERRIAELETTLVALESVARLPEASVTAGLMGIVPLRESAPAEFMRLVEVYGEIMDKVLESRVLKTGLNISVDIDDLGDRLGFMKATPRDVVDIHSAILRKRGKDVSPAKMRGYIEEGHFLLLELIGHLANYYRSRASGVGIKQ
jgi:PAS domain S-box-containing protein